MIHPLKLDSLYYEDSVSGLKPFEIRRNDRDFKVGDILELRDWVYSDAQKIGAYTGLTHWKMITYILEDAAYLQPGYVCLGVVPIAEPIAAERSMTDGYFAGDGTVGSNAGKCYREDRRGIAQSVSGHRAGAGGSVWTVQDG